MRAGADRRQPLLEANMASALCHGLWHLLVALISDLLPVSGPRLAGIFEFRIASGD